MKTQTFRVLVFEPGKSEQAILVMRAEIDKSCEPHRIFVGADAMKRATLYMVEQRHQACNRNFSYWTQPVEVEIA